MSTCRLCSESKGSLIKYSVRHYVHPACGLKRWGAAFFDKLHLWQLEAFPALIAHQHNLYPALEAKIDGLRAEKGRRAVAQREAEGKA